MSTSSVALALPQIRPERSSRDRLELLTALINAPSFEPAFRADLARIPLQDPVYPWHCVVADCERPRTHSHDLCVVHGKQWLAAQPRGVSRAEFVRDAMPLKRTESLEPIVCRICLHRPAFLRALAICDRHRSRWRNHQYKHGADADFEQRAATQSPCHSYGRCRVRARDDLAEFPLGLCIPHKTRYRRAGKPGGAALPTAWYSRFERVGLPVAVGYDDETAFRRWCGQQSPIMRGGEINLRGLPALVKAEIQWGCTPTPSGAAPRGPCTGSRRW